MRTRSPVSARPSHHPSTKPRGRQRAVGAAIVLGLAGMAAAGCGAPSDKTADAGPSVLASFYPLQFLAERIAGPDATVTSLTPPGAEPHDLELSPSQVAQIGQADLVIYIAGFQPAVDEAIAARAPAHVIDAATLTSLIPLVGGEDHADEAADADSATPCPTPTEGEAGICAAPGAEAEGSGGEGTTVAGQAMDPHFWLDPTRMEPVASVIAAELSAIAPAGSQTYEANRVTAVE
ncbi:MAG: metal ABC transporter substrate-binding protein, partial [Bifidobacteriaceae bacterium]|nr:metal ABC transporter substrate-binding protein [Bifidobacteriaceae bacterium]